METETKISFEYIKEHCKTIEDLKKLCSDVENLKELKGGINWNDNGETRTRIQKCK